jgi:hypothetical protein
MNPRTLQTVSVGKRPLRGAEKQRRGVRWLKENLEEGSKKQKTYASRILNEEAKKCWMTVHNTYTLAIQM